MGIKRSAPSGETGGTGNQGWDEGGLHSQELFPAVIWDRHWGLPQIDRRDVRVGGVTDLGPPSLDLGLPLGQEQIARLIWGGAEIEKLPTLGSRPIKRPIPSTGLQAPPGPKISRPKAVPVKNTMAIPTVNPVRPAKVKLVPGAEAPWEEGLTFEEQRAILIHNENVRKARKVTEPTVQIPEQGQKPVIVNTPIEPVDPIIKETPQEDSEMAIDWGTWTQDLAGDYLRNKYITPRSMPQILPAGYVSPGAAAAAGTGLGYLVEEGIDMLTGEKKKCRRRRRRLLTPTDLGDLAQLQALVGKGEVMKVAVMKALSRR